MRNKISISGILSIVFILMVLLYTPNIVNAEGNSTTITFDLNMGNNSNQTTYTNIVGNQLSSVMTELPTPVRDGFKFVGWFTSPSGGDEVTLATVITDNPVYYARWDELDKKSIITVDYSSIIRASTKKIWRITGWVLTTDKTASYTVSNSSIEFNKWAKNSNCTKYTIDSVEATDAPSLADSFKFNEDAVLTWALQNGSLPIIDTGYVTVYAQPIFSIYEKDGDSWSEVKRDIRSIKALKSYANWTDIGKIVNCYNQQLTVKVDTSVKVTSYIDDVNVATQATTNNSITGRIKKGSNTLTNYCVGQTTTLVDLGLTETITNDSGRNYVLYGLRLNNAIALDGTTIDNSVFLAIHDSLSSRYNLTASSQLFDAYNVDVTTAREGYNLDSSRSQLFDGVCGTMIRIGKNTTIDAYYTAINNEATIYTRASFFNSDGELLDSSIIAKTTTLDKKLITYGNYTTKLNALGITPMQWHDGTNKWQLQSIQIGTIVDNVSTDIISVSTQKDFDVKSTDWDSSIANYDLNIQLGGDSVYVIEARYEIYAPQVELSYFLDSAGEYHLFSVTSDNNQFIELADTKRHFNGSNTVQHSFNRILKSQVIDNCSKNLILTKSFVYTGSNTNSVKGYLSDIYNCWTETSLPTGGHSVQALFNDVSAFNWSLDETPLATTSLAGETSKLSVKVTSVPITPLIYIAIYREMPQISTVSFVAADSSFNALSNSTKLKYLTPKDGKILYQPNNNSLLGTEYTRAKTISVEVGTSYLNSYAVYSQDGIDDGIEIGGTATGGSGINDSLNGWYTLDDDRYYCTRYAWVTDEDAINAILVKSNPSQTISFGDLTDVTAFNDETLCANLYLKNGKGLLVKIFTPTDISDTNITNRERQLWKVNYLNTDTGDNGGTFSNPTIFLGSLYQRLARAQLTGIYRSVIDNSTDESSFLEYTSDAVNGYKLQLTNVGVSKANVFTSDSQTSGAGQSVTDLFHSTSADNSYAVTTKSLLETTSSYQITWRNQQPGNINTVSSSSSALSELMNQSGASATNGTTWNWYVYRYAKAYWKGSVLENSTGTNSYTMCSAFSKHELNPHTVSYSVGFEPVIEDKESGKLFYLKQIIYGYSDSTDDIITENTVKSLIASTSTIHNYAGGSYSVDSSFSDQNNTTLCSFSINGNVSTNVDLLLDSEQLHVIAVYALFEPTLQKVNVATSVIGTISYRDTNASKDSGISQGAISTGVVKSTTVSAAKNSNSKFSLADNSLGEARFKGYVYNDFDRSSDNYVAAIAIPSGEYLRTTASVPEYLADVDYNVNKTDATYTTDYYKGINGYYTTTDSYGNSTKIYSGTIVQVGYDIERSAIAYSLAGSVIWYPTDVSFRSNTLAEQNFGVTMKANEIKQAYVGSMGISINGKVEWRYPVTDSSDLVNQLSICNGTSSVACSGNSFQELENAISTFSRIMQIDDSAVNEVSSLVGDVLAKNESVKFLDGDGVTTEVIHQTSNYTAITSAPYDVPYANNTEADIVVAKADSSRGLFSSTYQSTVDADGNAITDIHIAKTVADGIWSSYGKVHYATDYSNAMLCAKDTIQYDDPNLSNADKTDVILSNGINFSMDVNQVTILTPVLLNVGISDESDADQSIVAGAGFPLVLDKVFTVSTNCFGQHSNLPGYGNKDYSNYLYSFSGDDSASVAAIRIKFPFPVVIINQSTGDETNYSYLAANHWFVMGSGQKSFVLPSFVEEGDLQSFSVEAIAYNAVDSVDPSGNIVSRTDKYSSYDIESNRNLQSLCSIKDTSKDWQYVARTNVFVDIVGRLYGLTILSYGDANNNWGELYSGLADETGLLTGKYLKSVFPSVENNSFARAAYKVKFKVTTVGSMYSSNDIIMIKPTFYWVDSDGKSRTKVDLYYDTESKAGIRIGDDFDNAQVKYISFQKSNLGVSTREQLRTAQILGYDDVSLFSNHITASYTYSNIQLNQFTRIFAGDTHETFIGLLNSSADSTGTNGYIDLNSTLELDDYTVFNIPKDVIGRSVQDWYGEYYLPAGFHVTASDFITVSNWFNSVDEGEYYSNDENDTTRPVWLTNGYLIVNFEITSVNNGIRSLGYDATRYNDDSNVTNKTSGECNMWLTESYKDSDTSSTGIEFNFEEGDFLVYDLSSGTDGAVKDYTSGGTH